MKTSLDQRRRQGARLGMAWVACAAATVTIGCGEDEPATTGQQPSLGAVTAGTTATTGLVADAGVTPPVTAGSHEMPACDVLPIFEAKCQSCHGEEPLYGAPMPLVDYADFQGFGPVTTTERILDLIRTRIHDTQKPMPPAGDLTEAEKAAIDGWLAAGAPSDQGLGCGVTPPGNTGGATGGATGTADGGTTTPPDSDSYEDEWPPPDADECFEMRAHAPGDPSSPHQVGAGTETHPEVVFDAPWGDRPAQAVGFRPITDNAKVLHHWILYENSSPAGAFLVGWAPGNEGRRLPEDVGMYVPSGPQSMYLDMHYYNKGANSQDEIDSSGVEVCVAYEDNMRPNTATVFMDFSNILGLRLPPQQDTDIVDYCRVNAPGPITTMSVSPHMHELGYHAKLEVMRADTGAVEVWHDKGFAFEDQQINDLGGKVIYPGDVVKTTCSYRNTTNQEVRFGSDTGDEMCFNFVTYYPEGSLSCDPLSDYLGYTF